MNIELATVEAVDKLTIENNRVKEMVAKKNDQIRKMREEIRELKENLRQAKVAVQIFADIEDTLVDHAIKNVQYGF